MPRSQRSQPDHHRRPHASKRRSSPAAPPTSFIVLPSVWLKMADASTVISSPGHATPSIRWLAHRFENPPHFNWKLVCNSPRLKLRIRFQVTCNRCESTGKYGIYTLYSGTRHKLELFVDRPRTDVAHKQGHKFYSYNTIRIFQRNLRILWQYIRVICDIRMYS